MIQPIENAIEEIKSGKMIILVDSEDRENEGDLVVAAEFADKEKINFMAAFGRGLICIPMEVERLKKLGLNRMVDDYSLETNMELRLLFQWTPNTELRPEFLHRIGRLRSKSF